jgi:hypothetical protein
MQELSDLMSNLDEREKGVGTRPGKAICVILAYNCGNVLERTWSRIPKGCVDRIILSAPILSSLAPKGDEESE